MTDERIPVPLPNRWAPRPYQEGLWDYLWNGGTRASVCCHRRWGKDDVSLHFTAVASQRRVGGYWHMLPKYEQARKAIWEAVNPHTNIRRIDEAFPPALRETTREQEMFIKFTNGSTWQVVGSDNYNALVGSSPCGLVFSEYALADPAAWAYLRPILRENHGWAVFISTPRGKNHFYELHKTALENPHWYAVTQTVADTQIMPMEGLQEDLRELQAEHGDSYGKNLWLQEYYCSFDAAIPGAIWADCLDRAKQEGRLTDDVPFDPLVPVDTGWDLGRTDDTAVWFRQATIDSLNILDHHSSSGKDIPFYVEMLLEKQRTYGWRYGTHWLPHDARPRTLAAGGKSVLQQLQDAAAHHPSLGRFAVIPRLDRQEGIQAARKSFPSCRFHATRCEKGLKSLWHYHREWDTDLKKFVDTPVHDWCLAEGTEILTPSGWKAVETLSVHEHVLTPLGNRRILRAGVVRLTDQWVTVRGITCTPEHRFFTSRGLVEASDLSSHSELWTRDSWGLKCLAFLCAILHFGFTDAITSATRVDLDPCEKQASSFIAWCMRLCVVKFRQVMTSIIETVTHGITILTTWKRCPVSSIAQRINRNLASSASAWNVEPPLDAIRHLERPVLLRASESGTHDANACDGQSEKPVSPAYNLTVESDHCYFVRGSDDRAYLVSNSSHDADAWRTLCLSWKFTKAPTLLAPFMDRVLSGDEMKQTFGYWKTQHLTKRRQAREETWTA